MNSNQSDNRSLRSDGKASQINHACNIFNSISLCDVFERNNMFQALKRVKSNKGCAGTDGMTVEELSDHLKLNWPEIKTSILEGRDKPKPVKVVLIPKPKGGERMLGIPNVTDRLIQQAILQKLSPIFDHGFSDHSYGFRVGKNAHQAILKARKYQEEGYINVVDIDLENFFDEVNHDRLMAKLAIKIKDKKLLFLIRGYLQAGMMQQGIQSVRNKGTPQGSPLSPLLSNIVLDELDKELEKRGHKFCRYADDCNIYVKSHTAGERVYKSISNFIETKLRLKVNHEKSATAPCWRRDFLGYSFLGQKKVKIRCSNESIKRFKYNIKQLTRGHDGKSVEHKIERINIYIRGWFGYFKLAETTRKFKEINGWIRARLRMCLLKSWPKPRTRVKMMLRLGMPLEEARFFAQVKRHWHLAHIKSAQVYMNKAFWNDLGFQGLEWHMEHIAN
jgi:RNA-directed DNA polymerase